MVNRDDEQFLYNLILELSSMGAPIVFKGAMILKYLQDVYGNPSGLNRNTRDVDGDWIGDPPTMNYLYTMLDTAIRRLGYTNFELNVTREWAEKKSVGFSLRIPDYNIVVGIDLSVKKNIFSTVYTGVNGINFLGQTMDKIIADKIVVLTHKTVCRRIKDFIDLYILSFMYCDSFNAIMRAINMSGNQIGLADTFRTHADDMRHAYSKYRNESSKLDFDIVYKRVYIFAYPFLQSSTYLAKDLQWNEVSGWS